MSASSRDDRSIEIPPFAFCDDCLELEDRGLASVYAYAANDASYAIRLNLDQGLAGKELVRFGLSGQEGRLI